MAAFPEGEGIRYEVPKWYAVIVGRDVGVLRAGKPYD